MSLKIKKNVITITHGDTLDTDLMLTHKSDGSEYIPSESDRIRFAIKKRYEDPEPLILAEIPTSTLNLLVEASEMKKLEPGEYYYDVEVTLTNGHVDTVIDWMRFIVTKDVC